MHQESVDALKLSIDLGFRALHQLKEYYYKKVFLRSAYR